MGPNSMTIKEEMEFRQKLLDEYENKISLPKNEVPVDNEELAKYLTMDKTAIESLDAGASICIAVRLAQFSLYMQRCINTELSRIKWANFQLSKATTEDMKSISTFLKHETKLAIISKENAVVNELCNVVEYAEERVVRLTDIVSNIKNIGYLLSLKRGSYYEHNRQS